MPTNVDKALNPAPQGLELIVDDAAPAVLEMEVEIVDDEGNVTQVFDKDGNPVDEDASELDDQDFNANLADVLDASELNTIAADLNADINNDRNTRADWEKTYKEGLKLLGLKIEERKEPWDGAFGATHPIITEAVVRFQSECVTETFPAAGPVRTKILGKETTAKKEAAARVEEDMNHELTDQMPEFRSEHEKLLFALPSIGCGFKKVYNDPGLGRQTSLYVPAEDIILPYGTTDLHSCHRITHVMRKTKNELLRLMEEGFYRTVDLDQAPKLTDDVKEAKDKNVGMSDINDDRFQVYEVHVELVIPSDPFRKPESKVAIPYVVTLLRDTYDVLAIRRNWLEDDPTFLKRQHFVQYDYITTGFGPYGMGLFHLIGGFAAGATAILRQLVDAGTLSNLPGGLKARGLRIKGDDTPIAPGEFRDVDIGSGNIRDNILPLPYKEPSATLYNLLNTVVEEARRFSATADMKVSDMSAQAPVGTMLALIERQLKVLSAVQARVHSALAQELRLLKGIIRDNASDEYTYDPDTGTRRAKKSDYDMVDVIPVSDPNAATMSQRVVQHQAAIQMAQMAPEIYDLPHLHREMLDTLGFKNAAKIVPLPEDIKPQDPVTENMAILRSKPIKVFMHQDHMAHIAVHQAAMQDPMLLQLIGQNPKAQMMMAAAQSHIAEHAAYVYRQRIEQSLGVTLPPEDEQLPPEVETAIAGMMAQAAQQVLTQNKAFAAAQAAQQAAQDPMVQLQMRELADKEKKTAIAEKKVLADAAAKADQIELERTEIMAKYGLKAREMQANAQRDQEQIAGQNMQAGMRLALDHSKAQAQERQAREDRAASARENAENRASRAKKPASGSKK